MRWFEALSDVAASTRASEEAVDRLRDRVDAGDRPIPVAIGATPTPAQIHRLHNRVGARRRARKPWLAGAGGLAAAAIVVAAAVGTTAWALWPAVTPDTVALELSRAGSEAALAIGDHVAVRYTGEGDVTGSEDDLTVAWRSGSLDVEVTPDQGVSFVVRTEEATVRVVGTAFNVRRDPLGTRISVARGHVEVACTRGSPHHLAALESHTCLPTSPAGLLGRAAALRLQDTPPEDVLATVDLALGMAPPPGEVRGELLATRTEALVSLRRWDDALGAAEQYLANGDGPRTPTMQRIAARLAMRAGCDRAVPHLRSLASPTDAEVAQLEACASAVDAP